MVPPPRTWPLPPAGPPLLRRSPNWSRLGPAFARPAPAQLTSWRSWPGTAAAGGESGGYAGSSGWQVLVAGGGSAGVTSCTANRCATFPMLPSLFHTASRIYVHKTRATDSTDLGRFTSLYRSPWPLWPLWWCLSAATSSQPLSTGRSIWSGRRPARPPLPGRAHGLPGRPEEGREARGRRLRFVLAAVRAAGGARGVPSAHHGRGLHASDRQGWPVQLRPRRFRPARPRQPEQLPVAAED